MKKISKILSILLAIIMMFSIIPITASAAEPTSGSCGDNLTWTYNMLTGVLTISGTGDMYDFNYHHLSNTGDTPWSVYIEDIKKIIIEDGVTSIGDYAFYRCSNLSDIIIGDEVTTINSRAFQYCTGLNTVTIGNGVTTIEKYAFYGCEGLTSVIIPVSVTDMDSGAFYECSGITDVYYEGTQEQWIDNIIFSSNDSSSLVIKIPFNKDVTIHYNYHIHKYNSVVKEPTCTEQGYTTYTCECGDNYVDDYVDALGHTPADAVEENYIAPTCTENGSKDVVVYCSACNEELSRETEAIEATGHEDTDNDGYCNDCDLQICDHRCHKSDFAGFIWKILRFVNRIFGTNKYCECGVAHY